MKTIDVQKPILEKLSNMGFGVKNEDGTFANMPMKITSSDYPFALYLHLNYKPLFIKTFHNWDELYEFFCAIV